MHVISVLSVLLIVTNALANKTDTEKPETETNLKEVKLQELEPIPDASEVNGNKRAKKSTTTTFCVEIRPSGPDQKPFQVCEPVKPNPEPAPSQAYSTPPATTYYSAPSYGSQDQPKPQAAYPVNNNAYKPPSQPKTGAMYAAPVKTYSAPTTPAPKQYAAHGMSYNSYRKSEESGAEEHGHLMRMIHGSVEEEDNADSSMVADVHSVKSSSYTLPNYGSSSYSSASSYVPVLPKKHPVKHQSHNGLVITCQPNLAGYAHNVPSSLHHPPAVPNYSYRSTAPYGGKFGRYQLQSEHSYGSYQQLPQFKPASGYKIQSTVHQSAGQQSASLLPGPSRSAYGPPSYAPQEPSYNPPVFKPPQAPIYSAPLRPQAPPSYAPPPSAAYGPASAPPRPQAPPSYAPPPSAAYGPAPAPPQSHLPVQPAVPIYVPQNQPPQSPQPHSPESYGQFSQNYAPAPAAPQPAPAHAPAPSYNPPSATYGSAPASYSAPPAPAAPAYAPAAVAPAPPPTSTFSQTQSYSANLPIPGPSPPSVPQGQTYVPPGTYGETEEESRMQATPPANSGHQEEKEKHTLKKMEEMSHQRAAGTQWASEMAPETPKNSINEKHIVESSHHQGWSQKMIAAGKTDKMKVGSDIEKHSDTENEIE